MTDHVKALREQLVHVLAWNEAHATFDKAVADLPRASRGATPPGFEHSPWQLLEHLRLAQHDLLEFCVNANYSHTLNWPDDYWPRDPSPSSDAAWDSAVAAFNHDREQLRRMIQNPEVDLFATVPTGKGTQTFLRAVMLVIDHNAYHVGQLVAVRRALGAWG